MQSWTFRVSRVGWIFGWPSLVTRRLRQQLRQVVVQGTGSWGDPAGRRTLIFPSDLLFPGKRQLGLMETFFAKHTVLVFEDGVSEVGFNTCCRHLVPCFRHAWLPVLRRCLGTGLHHVPACLPAWRYRYKHLLLHLLGDEGSECVQ